MWEQFYLWTLIAFSYFHLLMLLYTVMFLTFGTSAFWACVCVRGANGYHTAHINYATYADHHKTACLLGRVKNFHDTIAQKE